MRTPSMHGLHPQQRDNQVTERQEKHQQQGTARTVVGDGMVVGGVIDNDSEGFFSADLPMPVFVPTVSDQTVGSRNGDEDNDDGGIVAPVAGEHAGGAEDVPRTSDTKETILATEDEVRGYALTDDEVLLDVGDGHAQVMSLRALVCNDILATQDSYVPVRTEFYPSVEAFFGEGGTEWTPDEERKLARHNALRAELAALYNDIGAFSLEEALALYFTDDYVRRYAGGDPRDRTRVEGWLRYVRSEAGMSLTNPAGFLRTRCESAQWAPKGVPGSMPGSHRRRL